MLEGKRVAVVVPAHDEERLVIDTLGGIPDLVDRVYVVDDASADATAENAGSVGDPRVEVIRHERNLGVGAAIVAGYRRAAEEGIDVTCVMAGDNQMDPSELAGLVEPVARGEVEYAKANRLFSGEAWDVIPHTRFFGNAVLSPRSPPATGTSQTRRRGTRPSPWARCGGSISTGCIHATASRTTCSCT